jgi:hypothetical protein
MYQRAQEQQAASTDGADTHTNGAGTAEEDVVDAEVVDEGKK